MISRYKTGIWTFIGILFAFILFSPMQVKANNELVFSINNCNETNTMPIFVSGEEHEDVGPDAFYISDNKLFIDDTVNNQILVYENGVYSSSIVLPWNQNVKLLYFDSANDNIKAVYEDKNDSNCSHLYLIAYNLISKQQISDAVELSNEDQWLLEYYFDKSGNLLTEYYNPNGRVNEENQISIASQIYSEVGIDNDSIENRAIEYINDSMETVNYSLVSQYYSNLDNTCIENCVLLMEQGEPTGYLLPEEVDPSDSKSIYQVGNDTQLYQMISSNNGIRIFQLKSYPINQFDSEKMISINIEKETDLSTFALRANYPTFDANTIANRIATYKI